MVFITSCTLHVHAMFLLFITPSLPLSFHFAANAPAPSLWVGTNAGIIYVFTLNIPVGENRVMGNVMAEIGEVPSLYFSPSRHLKKKLFD